MATTGATSDLIEPLRATLARSIDYFLRTQAPAGYWVGELESNAAITAEYLFLRRLLGQVDPAREEAVAAYLLAGQRAGGWPLFYDGPPDLNVTVEAAAALQLAGVPDDAPALRQAAEVVRELGGVGATRVFTRIWLAMLGALPWDAPAMPPEMMLLPRWTPLNIYRFASWARGTIVPLLLVLANPPRYAGPAPRLEAFTVAGGRAGRPPRRTPAALAFRALDAALHGGEGALRHAPTRAPAIRAARDWIVAHQEADGGWGGIQPAMAYSTLALAGIPGCESAAERGLAAIEGFCIEDAGGRRMQSCVSPGWDTPWAMLALRAAGLPPDHAALRRAAGWLLAGQSQVAGDWAVRAPGVPAGGWAFEFHNAQYPDVDDTALVLYALQGACAPAGEAHAAGVAWLLGMQNRDGGWAAFDRENHTALVEQIPFCDFGEVLDPSSVDVTAHVLELLGALGYTPAHPVVAPALRYIWREQEPDGAWFGRWGVNYVYGTSAALAGLAALGVREEEPRVARAAAWLRGRQNDDGGWGETCQSYVDRAWRGRGPSTASQTAWAVAGLLACAGPHDPSLAAGVRWLLSHQRPDGAWDEPYFSGAGFPGDFYIKYHEYRNYFPTLALGRVLAATSGA